MSATTEELRAISEKVEGWLSNKEGELLYKLAKNCSGRGVIVEIGSWKGKSTIWLAKGSKSGMGIKVYAVDPHIGFPDVKETYGKIWTFDEFKNNITGAGVSDVIIPIVKTSEDAAKDFNMPVELIFIDGVHQYDYVKQDFELWFPKVAEGGIMAFHDTTGAQDAKQVVEEFVYRSKYFRRIRFADSITFAEKVKHNSFTDRIMNRYILLLKHLYEFACKIYLPKPLKSLGKKILALHR
jgi:predicted O-methyltransferase YrrM